MTTTYDKLDTINDSLNDIKTAIIGKGQTPSGNITTYATAINNIVKLNGETRTETLTSSAGNTFTPSSGKNAITSITVTPNNQARSVTPSTSSQTLSVNSGYSGNGTISVGAVTASIDANITAENIKKDVTILNVTGTYEGSGGGEIQLTRIKDDSNNEIGTHFMDFTDGNGRKYKVVCLDAQYRLASGQWCSSTTAVTDMPMYSDLKNSNVYEAKDTATSNTQKIIDYCTANNYTSTACSHCRSKSFIIDGITYYGQLPNLLEMIDIAKHYNELNIMDTSGSSYSSTNFNNSRYFWSSSQSGYNLGSAWSLDANGETRYTNFKTNNRVVCPVLEIPY